MLLKIGNICRDISDHREPHTGSKDAPEIWNSGLLIKERGGRAWGTGRGRGSVRTRGHPEGVSQRAVPSGLCPRVLGAESFSLLSCRLI